MEVTRTIRKSPVKLLLHALLLLVIFLTITPISFAKAQKELLTELSDNTILVINSGLIWQQERTDKIRNFMAMKNYVTNAEIEGWRLPTKQELYELIEIFDLHQNGTINMNLDGSYWLIDDNGKPVTGAWEIGDQCGPSRSYYPHKRGHIRLVRNQ